MAYGIHWGREWGKVGDFCRKVLYFCRKTDNFLLLMDNLCRIGITSVYQEEQVQVNPVDISLNCVSQKYASLLNQHAMLRFCKRSGDLRPIVQKKESRYAQKRRSSGLERLVKRKLGGETRQV